MRAPEHRRAVGPLAVVGERHAHRAHAGGREILARVDRQDAGGGQRGGEVHLADHGMRMRRTQYIAIGLAGKVDVILEAAIAAEEALVLEAPHRLPDSELAHRSLSLSPPIRRPGESRDPPRREALKSPTDRR